MKRAFTVLSFVLCAILFIACSKANDTSSDEIYFAKEGLLAHFDKSVFDVDVSYLGGLSSLDERWVWARARNVPNASPDDAEIIIIGSDLVNSQQDVLRKAYDSGKFIIIGDANLDSLRAYRTRFNWDFIVPAEKPQGKIAFAFAPNYSSLLASPAHITESGRLITDEGASPFQAMRSLMSLIKKARQDKSVKSSVSVSELDVPDQLYSINFPLYKDIACSVRSETMEYYYRIFHETAVQYSVFSCYAPEESGGQYHGDYYSVKAIGTNFPPTIYERESATATTSIDGKPARFMWGEQSSRGLMKVKGPWNTQMKMSFRTYDRDDVIFCIEGHPSPESDIQVKDYTTVKTKEWSVGISGGFQGSGAKKGGSVGISLGFGGSTQNWVAYSMSDIGVKNNSDNNCASYEFNYQNLLPSGSGVSADDWDNASITEISKTRADFEAAWIWQSSPSGLHKDYDTAITPLVTEVSNSVFAYFEDRYSGRWTSLPLTESFSAEDAGFNLEVQRIPVGCLRIDNKCQTSQMLFNVQIVDNTTGEVVYTADNTIAKDEHLEVLLPQKDRNYSVSMNMGQSQSLAVPYYSFDSAIELNLLMDKSLDTRILSVSEGGGDFTTRAGHLRVVNQSRSSLVRNLRIFKSDGTQVYEYPNSLGYNYQADIYLNTDTEYYATMEFGSASNFKEYRSASNFKLPVYSSDEDIRVLIASSPDGGDFVELQTKGTL